MKIARSTLLKAKSIYNFFTKPPNLCYDQGSIWWGWPPKKGGYKNRKVTHFWRRRPQGFEKLPFFSEKPRCFMIFGLFSKGDTNWQNLAKSNIDTTLGHPLQIDPRLQSFYWTISPLATMLDRAKNVFILFRLG